MEIGNKYVRIGTWIYCRCKVCRRFTRFRLGTQGLLLCHREKCWKDVVDENTGLLKLRD